MTYVSRLKKSFEGNKSVATQCVRVCVRVCVCVCACVRVWVDMWVGVRARGGGGGLAMRVYM
jgi:hypothetical protein